MVAIHHAIRVLETVLDQLQLVLLQQQGLLPPTGSDISGPQERLDEPALCDAILTLRNLAALSLLRPFFDRVFASLFGE